MNKTITLITAGIVVIILSVFLVLDKIDLTTFGTFVSAILGVIYGFYQKIENKELIKTIFDLEDNKIVNLNTISDLKSKLSETLQVQKLTTNVSSVKLKKENKPKVK